MAGYLTHDLVLHITIFQVILLAILLSNIWITRRARRHPSTSDLPMVSVLVPARNEEHNIADCVQSLLLQDYPCFEVLVLDDGSSDATRHIIESIAATQPRLQVLHGEPPPEDALGKNWACTQLARHSRGDLLLFTDADTRHRPDALEAFVNALIGERADLLTGFPRELVGSWGERLLVPFFSWALYCFVPLILGYRLRLPALSSAVGQVMLFRREAYLAIGGHEIVSSSVVDDMSLARRVQSARRRWRVVHVADLVRCRMYRSSREAIDGFVKNLFAFFDCRVLPFLFAFFWVLVMFWEPIVVSIVALWRPATHAPPGLLAACLVLSFLLWFIHYLNLGIQPGLALLYPVTVLASVGVGLRSLAYTLNGLAVWRGRSIARPRWRWL